MKRERLRSLFSAVLLGVMLLSISGCYYDDHDDWRRRDGYGDRDDYGYRRGYDRDDDGYRRGYDRDDDGRRDRFGHDHDRDND